MSKTRWIKFGLVIAAAAAVVALALTAFTGTASAQGPGGRGGQAQNEDGIGLQGRWGFSQGTANMAGIQTQAQTLQFADLPPANPDGLTPDVEAALIAAILDEHHAYDTYQVVIDQFGAVRPFTNIQAAEASHIAALEFLFERYDLALPAIEPLETIPQFETLADACALGAAAEIANFELYDQWMAAAEDYPDVLQVFTALRDASEFQHLPAFERCAG